MKWQSLIESYSRNDVECYAVEACVDKQFCLPTPAAERVFSSALDNCSRAARLRKKTNKRTNNMANLLAIRWIKKHDPTAWIWDERYHFWDLPQGSTMLKAQEKFVEIMGKARVSCFQNTASNIRLVSHSKGRPDIATFSERDQRWRFIEAKRSSADHLNDDQKLWLDNLADFFGAGSAIELRFVLTD